MFWSVEETEGPSAPRARAAAKAAPDRKTSFMLCSGCGYWGGISVGVIEILQTAPECGGRADIWRDIYIYELLYFDTSSLP